ncbi:MAG: hypothetical protein AB7O44_33425 [Hyphomicrobiaceae bacterium]
MTYVYWWHETSMHAVKVGHGADPCGRRDDYAETYGLEGARLKAFNMGEDIDIKWAERLLHGELEQHGFHRITPHGKRALEFFALGQRTYDDACEVLLLAARHIKLAHESNQRKSGATYADTNAQAQRRQRAAEAERRRQEAERQRQAEEARREGERLAEEKRHRAAEEAARKARAEAERRRQEAERQRQAEEARREGERLAEEKRHRTAEGAARKAKAEALAKAADKAWANAALAIFVSASAIGSAVLFLAAGPTKSPPAEKVRGLETKTPVLPMPPFPVCSDLVSSKVVGNTTQLVCRSGATFEWDIGARVIRKVEYADPLKK